MLNQSSRQQPSEDAFSPGPVVPGYQVEHHHALHLLVINHQVVRCTATQYQVAMCLLLHYDQQVTYEELIMLFDNFALEMPDLFVRARKKLIKVISDLRMKLWRCGLCIVYLGGVGYMLVSRSGFAHFSEEQKHSPENQADS